MEQDIQVVQEEERNAEQHAESVDNDNETEEFKANKEDVCKQVNNWFLALLVLIGFIFLIRFFLSKTIPLYYSFLLLSCYRLISIAKNIVLFKNSQYNHLKSLHRKGLIIDILMILFYGYLMLYSLIQTAELVYCSIPLGLSVFIDKLCKVEYSSRIKEIADKVDYSLNVITFVTLLVVGLKESDTISWTWYSIFTPIWITALILIVISCIQIQMCLRSIKHSISGGNCSGFIDSLFIFIVTSGFAGCLLFLFLSLCQELDDGIFAQTKKALMLFTFYLILLFSTTFIIQKHVKALFHSKLYPDDFGENIIGYGDQIISEELIEIRDYPKKMKKISSTYFVPAEESVDIILEPEEQSIDGCRTCIICCSVEPNSIFMNCGHSGACFECACDVWKKTKNCMICSGRIEMVFQFDGIEDGFATVIKAVKYMS